MIKGAILGLTGLLLAGCARATVVRTQPPGAKLFVTEREVSGGQSRLIQRNKYIGLSPTAIPWQTRHEYTIKAILENFFPQERTFQFTEPPAEVILIFDRSNPAVIKFGQGN